MAAAYLASVRTLTKRQREQLDRDDDATAAGRRRGGLTAKQQAACDQQIAKACGEIRAARLARNAGAQPLADPTSGAKLPLHLLRRVSRLLDLGRSAESITEELQIDKDTVARVAAGEHPLQLAPRYRKCPGCGGQVLVDRPCQLCRCRRLAA